MLVYCTDKSSVFQAFAAWPTFNNYQGAIGIFVYKSLEGPVGFDKDQEGIDFLESFIGDQYVLVEKCGEKIKAGFSLSKVRSSAMKQNVIFHEPTDVLLNEFLALENANKLLKQNELLERYKKPAVEIPSTALAMFFSEAIVADRMIQNCKYASSWRYSVYGLHFYILASNVENLSKAIVDITQKCAFELSEVKLAKGLPVW